MTFLPLYISSVFFIESKSTTIEYKFWSVNRIPRRVVYITESWVHVTCPLQFFSCYGMEWQQSPESESRWVLGCIKFLPGPAWLMLSETGPPFSASLSRMIPWGATCGTELVICPPIPSQTSKFVASISRVVSKQFACVLKRRGKEELSVQRAFRVDNWA